MNVWEWKKSINVYRSHLIHMLRKNANYSLENVAMDLSISKTTLFQLEKGTQIINDKAFEKILDYYQVPFDADINRLGEVKEKIRSFCDALYERKELITQQLQPTMKDRLDYGVFHEQLLEFLVNSTFPDKDPKKKKRYLEFIMENQEVYDPYELALFYCVAGHQQIWDPKGKEAKQFLLEAFRLAGQIHCRKIESLAFLWLGQVSIGESECLEGLRLTQKAKMLFLEENQFNRILDADIQIACFLGKMNAYREATEVLERIEKNTGYPVNEVIDQRIWLAFQQNEIEKACELIKKYRTEETALKGNFSLLPLGYFLMGDFEKSAIELQKLMPKANDSWIKASFILVEDLIRNRRKNIQRTLKTLRHQSVLCGRQDIYRFFLGCVIEFRYQTLNDSDTEAMKELIEWQREWKSISDNS